MLLCALHLDAGRSPRLSFIVQWRARPGPVSPLAGPMVGTRATPNTSSPYPAALPEPRRKRKIPDTAGEPLAAMPQALLRGLSLTEASDSGASEKEIRAAAAARVRLYGGQPAEVCPETLHVAHSRSDQPSGLPTWSDLDILPSCPSLFSRSRCAWTRRDSVLSAGCCPTTAARGRCASSVRV